MSKTDPRVQAALLAIKQSLGSQDAEHDTNLFVNHHLEELEADYWQTHCGTTQPEANQILEILTLCEDQDEEGDTLDFSLPDEITDYLLSVCFDENGEVVDISMES